MLFRHYISRPLKIVYCHFQSLLPPGTSRPAPEICPSLNAASVRNQQTETAHHKGTWALFVITGHSLHRGTSQAGALGRWGQQQSFPQSPSLWNLGTGASAHKAPSSCYGLCRWQHPALWPPVSSQYLPETSPRLLQGLWSSVTPVSAKGGERELPCAASAGEAGPAPGRPILESMVELKRAYLQPRMPLPPWRYSRSCAWGLRRQSTAALLYLRKRENYLIIHQWKVEKAALVHPESWTVVPANELERHKSTWMNLQTVTFY